MAEKRLSELLAEAFKEAAKDAERFHNLVEVVRCKDCKHRCEYKTLGVAGCQSPKGIFGYCKENDFCSYGERRTDDRQEA